MKKISALRDELSAWEKLNEKTTSLLELAELHDESLRAEIESETEKIGQELDQRELSTLLAGQYDRGDAILAIHAGAVERIHRIGQKCLSACTCAGQKKMAMKPK